MAAAIFVVTQNEKADRMMTAAVAKQLGLSKLSPYKTVGAGRAIDSAAAVCKIYSWL